MNRPYAWSTHGVQKPFAIRLQDSALAHYGVIIRDWLNAKFAQPITWPPRSPDLTPLDFYVWDYMKDYLYSRKHLLQRNEEAAVKVRENC